MPFLGISGDWTLNLFLLCAPSHQFCCSRKSLKICIFIKSGPGSTVSKPSEGSHITTSIGILRLIDLAVDQPPSTLANTSKHLCSCFSEFPSDAVRVDYMYTFGSVHSCDNILHAGLNVLQDLCCSILVALSRFLFGQVARGNTTPVC